MIKRGQCHLGHSGFRLLLALVGFLLAMPFASTIAFSAPPVELAIFHTNNITGHLFGCPT